MTCTDSFVTRSFLQNVGTKKSYFFITFFSGQTLFVGALQIPVHNHSVGAVALVFPDATHQTALESAELATRSTVSTLGHSELERALAYSVFSFLETAHSLCVEQKTNQESRIQSGLRWRAQHTITSHRQIMTLRRRKQDAHASDG